jgi:hypothetical protein
VVTKIIEVLCGSACVGDAVLIVNGTSPAWWPGPRVSIAGMLILGIVFIVDAVTAAHAFPWPGVALAAWALPTAAWQRRSAAATRVIGSP